MIKARLFSWKETALLSLLCFLFLIPGYGQGSLQEELHRAEDFIQKTPDMQWSTEGLILKAARTWQHQGKTLLVLAVPDDHKGFILVSGASCPTWIPGYSLHSRVDPNDLPPAMEWLLQWYLDELKDYIQTPDSDAFPHTTPNQYTSPEVLSPAGVTPLLSSTWDQRCYYNDSCPSDPTAPAYYCGKAPAGCVATTMAQIMKYHQWPIQGTGTKSYFSIRYGTISANFGNTFYQIASMPDAVYNSNPAVARLLWHAGIASQMNYAPYGSGTGITDARNAFVNHFGFKPSAQIVTKNSYTDTDWRNLMRAEIDQGRPVFYSGTDQASNTGHAWVLDGYNGNNYFHFNWGWSGIADGYFTLTNLNPLGGANYTMFQEAIIGIEPQGNNPVASFTADTVQINPGSSINYTDLSGGMVNSWQWFFHGGQPSSWSGPQSPPIYYPQSGIFDVILVAGNGTLYDTLLKKAYISVLPLAGFTASQRATEAGRTITFQDATRTNNPIQSYHWYFFGGQPSSSTLQYPGPILYPQAGQYPVLLEVNDGNHTDKKLELQFITVYNQCDTLLNFYMPGWYVQPVNQPTFQVYQEDLDGLTPYHHQNISSGWDYFTEAGNNQFVSATSLFQSPGIANNWLIFGPVTLPATGASLQWKHKFPDHTKRDGYAVLLSTTGYTHTHFTSTPLFTMSDNDAFTLGDTVWTIRSAQIPSAPYGNQSVWIGVHHYADNMFYIALDDFRVIHCDAFPQYADFFTFDTLIAAGDTIVFYDFSSGSPDQRLWNFPGGLQINTGSESPMVSYPLPGIYDVSLTAIFGTASQSVTKTGYIKVAPNHIQPMLNPGVKVLAIPNPFSSVTRITGIAKAAVFEICDLQGRVVRQGWLNENQQLNLQDLASGIWIIKIKGADSPPTVIRLIKTEKTYWQ